MVPSITPTRRDEVAAMGFTMVDLGGGHRRIDGAVYDLFVADDTIAASQGRSGRAEHASVRDKIVSARAETVSERAETVSERADISPAHAEIISARGKAVAHARRSFCARRARRCTQ